MITRKYAAWLACVAIYREPEQFDQIIKGGPDTIGVKVVNNTWCAVPLGTVDLAMWESNAEILPTTDPVFGEMHTGFLTSGRAIYAALKGSIATASAQGLDIYLAGHSRGGSLADEVAAECARDGIKVTVALFEAAPIGKQQYVDWCAAQVRAGLIRVAISTDNGIDVVPYSDVALGYAWTYARTNLDHPPGGLDDLDLADWHEGATIYAGMDALDATAQQ